MSGNTRSFVELPGFANLRVHTVSGAPDGVASTANVTTLYVSPFRGDSIWLPVGGVWQRRTVPSETSVALGTSTASRGRDLWAYASGNSVAYELGTVWASGTARATGEGITWVDGIPCRESDTTRVLIASFYLTSTTQTQDSERQRLVWNMWNQISKPIGFTNADTRSTYSHTAGAWQQMGTTSTHQVEVFSGLNNASSIHLHAIHVSQQASGSGALRLTAIGVNSTTSPSGISGFSASASETGIAHSLPAAYAGALSLGYSYYAQLEYGATAGATFYGNNSGAAVRRHGTYGEVFQ